MLTISGSSGSGRSGLSEACSGGSETSAKADEDEITSEETGGSKTDDPLSEDDSSVLIVEELIDEISVLDEKSEVLIGVDVCTEYVIGSGKFSVDVFSEAGGSITVADKIGLLSSGGG